MRVTTLYASSAASSAAYYTKYLTAAPGEVPGVWMGAQADGLGLVGNVDGEQLQALASPATSRIRFEYRSLISLWFGGR
jgi:hypothetical protein